MKSIVALVLFSLLLSLGITSHARTPDGMTPSEETVCDELQGAAYGLCNAYCEAMDCDSDYPNASGKACENVSNNYSRITGEILFCSFSNLRCQRRCCRSLFECTDNCNINDPDCFDKCDEEFQPCAKRCCELNAEILKTECVENCKNNPNPDICIEDCIAGIGSCDIVFKFCTE